MAKSDGKHKAQNEEGEWKYFVRAENHSLIANKILERVWTLEKHGQSKPREFDDSTSNFIKLIRDESPLRISKLYKRSNMKMAEVDKLLAQLVYWKVVDVKLTERGTYYSMAQ